ncbi:MAG TPA: bifunctional diguanylate cyclase/phosphodiesterase [Afifellaceae bacterium]|nr:bifunctional diguanylate cyclase/phosphodiesterase [Afifellaceae bacterium]
MRFAALRASRRIVSVIFVGVAFGLVLTGASRLSVRAVLEEDARTAAAGVLQVASGEAEAVAAGRFSQVRAYLLLAADGTVVTGGPGEAPARPPEPAIVLHKQVLAADRPALISHSAWLPSLVMLGRPTFSHAAIPAPANLSPIATVYVEISQEGAGGALVEIADSIALTGAGLVLLAAFAAALAMGRGTASANSPAAAPGGRDTLTGLPDRLQFLAKLDNAINKARPSDGQLAILAINLDRFKAVNDVWGHEIGDAVLQLAAPRLKAVIPPGAQLARVSGDEFAVLVEGDANPRSLRHLSMRVIEELSEPFDIEGTSVSLTASVGIAAFPVSADSATELFRAADLALCKAKGDGGQIARFFDTEMERELKRRSALERDLRLALQREEFVVFYQPQLDLKSGQVCGYEALVRWERPGEGIVSPGEFIPVAEETGLIRPLGEWILRRACQDAVAWIENGIIAVNFSAAQFRFPGVDEMVGRVLQETGLDPRRLEIEITESLFLNHSAEVMSTLRRIKALGVRIAMDDFGTGYSSLSHLTQFPFDKIKVDRSFVRQLSDDPQIGAIISSIVGLGRSLSVDITAEGVETDEQVTLLQAAGCNIVQGFLFGAPQRSVAQPRPQQARA